LITTVHVYVWVLQAVNVSRLLTERQRGGTCKKTSSKGKEGVILLLTSPIAFCVYDCGYLNSASFLVIFAAVLLFDII